MSFQFNLRAFLLFLVFLVIEIYIAVYVKDSFIRPYGGDFLVVFLVYYFAKTFIKTNNLYLIAGVVIFAYLVETVQYFRVVEIFNIQNKIIQTIIGTSFSWGDIIAYTLGGVGCYILDEIISKKQSLTITS